jgi:hypothetical protein
MKLSHSLGVAGWLLIALQLAMAFASIWVFSRMSPAIETILEKNLRTLIACEEMLAALVNAAQNSDPAMDERLRFQSALQEAMDNITEDGESTLLAEIEATYGSYFDPFPPSPEPLVATIQALSKLNQQAMMTADHRAKKVGQAGAWGIVFMAAAVFALSLLFLRRVHRLLLIPVEEWSLVIREYLKGDRFRRCEEQALHPHISALQRDLNTLLDEAMDQKDDRFFSS